MFNILSHRENANDSILPTYEPEELQEQVSRLARYALWHNGSMDVTGIANYLLIEFKACSTRQDLWIWVWKNQNLPKFPAIWSYKHVPSTPGKHTKEIHIHIYCYLIHNIQGIETSLDIHQQMNGLNILNK